MWRAGAHAARAAAELLPLHSAAAAAAAAAAANGGDAATASAPPVPCLCKPVPPARLPCPALLAYREIIANLAKAAGLATMIAAMRPDIDNVDEYVRNTTARAFSGALPAAVRACGN